jgi:microcystin-dependent protein
MAVNPQNKNAVLVASKAPNLPIAPVEYTQQYQDMVLNALRLYFNQVDNFTQAIVNPLSGTTADRPIESVQAPIPVGQTYFDTTLNQLLLWNGTAWVPSTPTSAVVSSFSAGSTGLTPSTATSGAVTLAGILGILNGGTGLSSVGAAGTVLTSTGSAATWSAGVPTGAIQMWSTGTAPTGYLLCNGASVSTTTYATLFSVLGYTFGGSGGSFSLPNYTNRMPYGTTIGATGGSADAIVVSHTHSNNVSDPGHYHIFGGDDQVASQGGYSVQSGFSYDATSTTSGGGVNMYTHDSSNNNAPQATGISVSTNATGSSGTNANLPPYLGINFIIKT